MWKVRLDIILEKIDLTLNEESKTGYSMRKFRLGID